jgi:putative ABC transport system permease protein
MSDFRFAVRALKSNPTFVVLAAICLALGIGASTMMFTVVNDALLDPLGIVEEEGLVAVGEVHRSAPNQNAMTSPASLRDWQEAIDDSAQFAGLRGNSFIVGASGAERRVDGAVASPNFFDVLGVEPILGRTLHADDALAGTDPVVVISESYWRRQLNAARDAVGIVLPIGGTPHTVVGVVPSLLTIGMPNTIRSVQLWLPLPEAAATGARTDRSLFAIARLADGVGVEGFEARLRDVAAELAISANENGEWSVRASPLAAEPFGFSRSALLLSLAAAALLLLITCANLANLALVHAQRRRHEFGIRAAIGASPWRLARQLLAESTLVAFVGASFGLGLARVGLDVLANFYSLESLAPAELPMDWGSLSFAVGITCATTLLFGLWPALETARGAARAQIAESGTGLTEGHGRGVLRRGLIVAQLAASLVLLVGAALLGRSVMNLLALEGGVDEDRVTSIRVDSQGGADDAVLYTQRVMEALAGLPGVESVAATSNLLPLRGGGFRSAATLPSDATSGSGPVVAYTGVTPSFFSTLGVRLLTGRVFGANEQEGRVAIINERMARLLWPNGDALGAQFRLDAHTDRGWVTVVGIAADVLTWNSSGEEPLPMAFIDAASLPSRPVFFFVRTRVANQVLSPEMLTRAIDAAGFSISRIVVVPMANVAEDPFWPQRLFSLWFAVFGGAAVLLTVTGIYGVLSDLVSQRWRELGIRMAVGAGRVQAVWLVMREAGVLVAIGTAIGVGVALAVSHAMRGELFHVEPFDLAVFAAVAVFIVTVALASSVAPAIRASRVDPKVLLRA